LRLILSASEPSRIREGCGVEFTRFDLYYH
jgi:hypothetical protein